MKRVTGGMLLILLLVTAVAIAQEQTASIQGTAIDQSGATLPGVTIEAVNVKGQHFTTQSDREGNYRIPAVPPGTYTVTGSLSGLKSASVRKLQVTLGSSPKIDLKLGIAAVSEAITVTAEAPTVDVTSSTTQSTLRAETFDRLPIGRDFQSVVTLTPSAIVDPKSGGSGTGIHYGGVSIDGTTAAESRYVLDGIDTTDPQTGTAGKRVVTDMIEEVQVKTAGYQAEFGGALGGVVNVISKTGTNDYTGTVGGYFINSAWNGAARPTLEYTPDAEGYLLTTFPKDQTRRIDPSFSIGGPIIRDRLWFFGAYVPTVLNTTRTVNFRDSNNIVTSTGNYKQEFRRDNFTANVNGNVGSKFVFKAAMNLSPYKTTNTLPGATGRGASDPALYKGQDDKKDETAYSAYTDFVPTPQWYLSARGGRFYTNYRNMPVPPSIARVTFTGSNSTYGAPADLVRPSGFSNIPTNSGTIFDKYTRDTENFDVSWFPTFVGTHAFKAGIQNAQVKNDVNAGEQNYLMRFRWARGNSYGLPGRGKYGVMQVRQFQTTGAVTDTNLGLFVQDQWTVNNRLTLNLGIRTEKENVPSYNYGLPGAPKNAIEFGYGDKMAPRLGFAFDVFGNNQWKIYGSAGDYYDIFKMELPRGSFGGDRWIDYNFALDTLDWASVKCTGDPNIARNLTCGPGVTLLNSINLRAASTDPTTGGMVDPNIKPTQSREMTIGAQHELSPLTALGVRYTRKRLIRTVEDIGTSDQADSSEVYLIGNPGFGLARQDWYRRVIEGETLFNGSEAYPGFPKARRDYDAVEFEFTKRFATNWSAHASYIWSRLYGNYSGLVNADEATGASQAARVSPNVSRWGDMPWAYFSGQTGSPAYGLLPNDRTHQIKVQANYTSPFGMQFGINQYAGSGTPLTTTMTYRGVPFIATHRGDMGRTPWLLSTDLMIGHQIKLSGGYGIGIQLNVLNVFDKKTVIGREELWDNSSGGLWGDRTSDLTFAQFFKGFDPYAAQKAQGLTQDARYGQPSDFQAPREVQLEIKFTF